MEKKLQNKIALITGASGGIGQSIAIKLAKNGCKLILTYKTNYKSIKSLSDKLKLTDAKFDIIKADITKKRDRKKIIDHINIKTNNKIDILINNAGINKVKEFEKITEKDWDMLMDINLKSTFFLTQKIFNIMKKNFFGKIINISSGAALYHGPKTAHYAISKAGIISFTKLLARFGAKYNILCNAIAPGIVKTNLTKKEIKGTGGSTYINMTLLKKFCSLDDVSNAVLFLASNEQNYITGEVINITGGAYLG
jgi:3-oxoacyl-[acyl-carrier protein] reductase